MHANYIQIVQIIRIRLFQQEKISLDITCLVTRKQMKIHFNIVTLLILQARGIQKKNLMLGSSQLYRLGREKFRGT